MRFRPLLIDYKAEAMQLLKRNGQQNQQFLRNSRNSTEQDTCNEADGCKQQRHKRVIRIIVESNEAHGTANENLLDPNKDPRDKHFDVSNTTTPLATRTNSSRESPSLFTPMASNPDQAVIKDQTNANIAKVTPTSDTTLQIDEIKYSSLGNEGVLMGNIDCLNYENKQDQESHGQTDKHNGTAANPYSAAKAIDYKIIYETPWLLSLISSIRRQANRKRIANEVTVGILFPTNNRSLSNYCSGNSFSYLHHKLCQQAENQCRFTNSRRASLRRLENILTVFDRHQYRDNSIQFKRVVMNSSLPFLFRDNKGSFSSLCVHVNRRSTRPRSDVLEVSNPSMSSENNERHKQSAAGTNNSTQWKLLETMILTAAVACAYQQRQQQQQQQGTEVTLTTSLEGKCNNKKPKSESRLIIYEGTNARKSWYRSKPFLEADQFQPKDDIDDNEKKRPSLQERETDFVPIASERLKDQNGHFENKPIAVLENDLDRSEKKRSRSPSRDEDFSAQSPSKKPKEEKRWDDKIFEVADDATNGIDMLDKIYSEENILSKPNTTNLKQPPNQEQTENRLEKVKKKELFLLQRFGLISKRESSNDCESLKIASQVGNQNTLSNAADEGLEDLDRGRDDNGNTSGKEHIPENENFEDSMLVNKVDKMDYLSPVEFPTCNNYDDDDDDEEEDEESELGDYFDNATNSLKSDTSCTSTDSSHLKICTPKAMNKKRKQIRGAAPEEKTKKIKMSFQTKLDHDDDHSNCFEGNDDGIEDEEDRLETPRKLVMREFSPAKKSTNCDSEEEYQLEIPHKFEIKDLSPNKTSEKYGDSAEEQKKPKTPKTPNKIEKATLKQAENGSHNSYSPRKITITNRDKNDDVSSSSFVHPRGSNACAEDNIGREDPFWISPEEHLQTMPCQDAKLPKEQQNVSQIHLLCSDSFVENFGDVITEIIRNNSNGGQIQFTDTDLVNICHVDIELPSREAMVVMTLSQIQEFGGVMGTFLPRIVETAAMNRYAHLEVFVCVDIPLDSGTSRDLIRLQTAFMTCDRGLPRTETSIQLCSRKTLGACIARSLVLSTKMDGGLSLSALSNMDQWLSDPRTCQRLKFLLSIIPTLSVIGALYWLDLSSKRLVSSECPGREYMQHSLEGQEDKSAKWFQQCFAHVEQESNRLQSYLDNTKLEIRNFMNPSVPKQLTMVVCAHLKHI